MRLTKVIAACIALLGIPAAAEPLADMSGRWTGSGWAKQTPQGPQETVRCRITNTFDAATRTLGVEGMCAVPGRNLTLSGTLQGATDGARITGQWSTPDGIGSARIVGIQRDDIVAFNFAVIDPGTGRSVAQNVEWRISDDNLRLRSTDRKDPSVAMSDIVFSP